MRQRALLELGDSLLDHGVGAVLPLQVQEPLDPVGEHRVVPPDRDGQGLLVQGLSGSTTPCVVSALGVVLRWECAR